MGPSKIMIIRHAEKPGIYGKGAYAGINALGEPDPASLVTMGWERAGGVANLFYPTDKQFQNSELAAPNAIYAANPALPGQYKLQPNGNYIPEGTSQRPAQTISALYGKMSADQPVELNLTFAAADYPKMVKDVLSSKYDVVLIAWQHQYILPKKPGDDSIIAEFFSQTKTPDKTCPTTKWPSARYDMVLVLDLDPKSGEIVNGTVQQVPQMLLYGDVTTPIF